MAYSGTGPQGAYQTNADMQAVITAGGSVTWNGRQYYAIADLPTDDQINQLQGVVGNTVASTSTLTIPAGTNQIWVDLLTVNGALIVNGYAISTRF